MLTKDADHGHYNWLSYAHDLRVRYEIQESDTCLNITIKVINHFKSGVLQRLNNHITENRKLNLYASFKTKYKSEPYLDYITNFTVRSTLANLRLSARNLHIETGRFSKNKTPRDERCCPYCKTLTISAVENGVHFLLSCSLFNEE